MPKPIRSASVAARPPSCLTSRPDLPSPHLVSAGLLGPQGLDQNPAGLHPQLLQVPQVDIAISGARQAECPTLGEEQGCVAGVTLAPNCQAFHQPVSPEAAAPSQWKQSAHRPGRSTQPCAHPLPSVTGAAPTQCRPSASQSPPLWDAIPGFPVGRKPATHSSCQSSPLASREKKTWRESHLDPLPHPRRPRL